MKLSIGLFVIVMLSGCAAASKTNSEFLSSLPSSVRGEVCTNQRYLSCAPVTAKQCLATADKVGLECQKEARKKLESGSDQGGALGAFHGCVAAEHMMQTRQKNVDATLLCATRLYRNP